MRKTTFGVACSLDHYIAREDDSVDWILWCDEVKQMMTEYWKSIDTVVMGRKTYEATLAMGGGDGVVPAVKTYIMSRTLQPDPDRDKGAVIVNRDAVEFLAELKEQEGKDICVMCGGELAESLLGAGLIDEIGLNLHPVLLGSGVPLFRGLARQIDLELTECRELPNGCVCVTYRVRAQG